MHLYFTGIIIAFSTFFIIGLCHPLVIKMEYYFSARSWWCFAVMGVIALLDSLVMTNNYASIFLGVLSATNFWAISEIFEQRERVAKGWYPANPHRRS